MEFNGKNNWEEQIRTKNLEKVPIFKSMAMLKSNNMSHTPSIRAVQ